MEYSIDNAYPQLLLKILLELGCTLYAFLPEILWYASSSLPIFQRSGVSCRKKWNGVGCGLPCSILLPAWSSCKWYVQEEHERGGREGQVGCRTCRKKNMKGMGGECAATFVVSACSFFMEHLEVRILVMRKQCVEKSGVRKKKLNTYNAHPNFSKIFGVKIVCIILTIL